MGKRNGWEKKGKREGDGGKKKGREGSFIPDSSF